MKIVSRYNLQILPVFKGMQIFSYEYCLQEGCTMLHEAWFMNKLQILFLCCPPCTHKHHSNYPVTEGGVPSAGGGGAPMIRAKSSLN